MKQKRKGLTKPRHNTFNKEYSFEIKVVILFTLGIFLLVEDLEIKQYIFEFIQLILFSIGNGIKWLRDSILFLITISYISSLFLALNFFESFTLSSKWSCLWLIFTAEAQIGPAKEPLPTSSDPMIYFWGSVSYTHLRAHET